MPDDDFLPQEDPRANPSGSGTIPVDAGQSGFNLGGFISGAVRGAIQQASGGSGGSAAGTNAGTSGSGAGSIGGRMSMVDVGNAPPETEIKSLEGSRKKRRSAFASRHGFGGL